jgi:SAM-dependent methyltransferase
MSHTEQRIFVEKIKNNYPVFFSNKKILEIGSLNINGTLRDFFTNCNYLGIDVGDGPGVDVICEGQSYDAPDETYDVVCSAECFEHNPYWLETFKNMIRLCKKNGFVFFTCATDGRPEHGTSRTTPQCSPLTVGNGWEYYRNLNELDFTTEINFDSYFKSYGFEVNTQSHDLYFWGIKSCENNETQYKDPIPVIGTPIVNGVHWLKRLIDSVDYPVKEFFIINNNGRDEITNELNELCSLKHKFIEKIVVSHLPSNLGVSASWNLIIKSYFMSPYWIICNNDVAFTPGMLEKMHRESQNNQYGMIHGKPCDWGGGAYDLFLMKDWVVQKCGLFDENLYPAYAEDVDHWIRIKNEEIEVKFLNIDYPHGDLDYATTGSQTWRIDPSLKEKLDNSRILNETEYLNEKWGDNYNIYTAYKNPFDEEKLKSSFVSYDLNFIRRKYMGF